MTKVALGETVIIKPTGMDRYRRTLAVVILPDGLNVNQALVQHGYAWWYRRYAGGDSSLKAAEKHAKANKLGLWTEPNPIAPWDWRRGKR